MNPFVAKEPGTRRGIGLRHAPFFPGGKREKKMAKAFPVLGVSILFLCLAPANALIVLAAAALIPALIVIKES